MVGGARKRLVDDTRKKFEREFKDGLEGIRGFMCERLCLVMCATISGRIVRIYYDQTIDDLV